MAARKKNVPATRGGNKGLSTTTWEERMKQAAERAAEREPLTGGSSWLSTGNDGQFHFGDDVLGDTITVVVLDFVFDNAYYPGAYDADNPTAPDCFAIDYEEDDLVPHEDSPDPQSETCDQCWANVYGSADNGKGKACKNSRRLAVLAVDEESDYLVAEDSEIAFMRLSPSSLKYWKSYVAKLSRVTGLPPMGVITELSLHPIQGKAGYYVQPTLIQEIEDDDSRNAVIEAVEKLGEDLLTPYKVEQEEEAPARKPARGKAPARKPAAKKKAPARKPAAKKAPPKRRKF